MLLVLHNYALLWSSRPRATIAHGRECRLGSDSSRAWFLFIDNIPGIHEVYNICSLVQSIGTKRPVAPLSTLAVCIRGYMLVQLLVGLTTTYFTLLMLVLVLLLLAAAAPFLCVYPFAPAAKLQLKR